MSNNTRPMGTSLTLFTVGFLVLVIGGFAAWNGGDLPFPIMLIVGVIILCAGAVVSVLERILHAVSK